METTKSYKSIKKSNAAECVLNLMDADFTYSAALAIVLNRDKRLNAAKLEKELDNYI